jgi:hypothetical protein
MESFSWNDIKECCPLVLMASNNNDAVYGDGEYDEEGNGEYDEEDNGECDDYGGLVDQSQVLDAVLSRYLLHQNGTEEGDELEEFNVVDALLMIKSSIDRNSKCLLKLANTLQEKKQ